MFSINESLLLVIDVQGNLAYRMHDQTNLFKNIQKLIQGAEILGIPIIYTEQAPEKIGKTVPEVAQYLVAHHPIAKTTFSCGGEPLFMETLKKSKRSQIIIVGIEAHVCVYQTVVDLLEEEYEIQLVVDAISSRTPENKQLALNKMYSFGAGLTSAEMIMTELLKTSTHPKFKEILGLIR